MEMFSLFLINDLYVYRLIAEFIRHRNNIMSICSSIKYISFYKNNEQFSFATNGDWNQINFKS